MVHDLYKRITVLTLFMISLVGVVHSLQGEPPQGPGVFLGSHSQICGDPLVSARNLAPQSNSVPGAKWTCIPPYDMPVYTKPADQSIVFGSLLEASGLSAFSNKNWLGVAAGNFCGTQRELVLVTDSDPGLFRVSGPTPTAATPVHRDDGASGAWHAIAAGKFNGSTTDSLVALRAVTGPGQADLIIASGSGDCLTHNAVAVATGGNWISLAVGNFQDGKPIQLPGNQTHAAVPIVGIAGKPGNLVALLQPMHPQLALMKLDQGSLTFIHKQDLDPDVTHPSKWKAITAADIDGDGTDELIVVREVSDRRSPTVLALKWDAQDSSFHTLAATTFGNTGNSAWASATGGNFNGSARKAVVLVKNQHSNFAVVDFPPGASQLRVLATSDLDSTQGQNWTAVTATDWLGGDQGADELIAVRAANDPYRTNVFVYGNPFHRISRDTALAETKAEWPQHQNFENSYFTPSVNDLKQWLRGTHTNTLNWVLAVKQESPFVVHDFSDLVSFLSQTKNWGVDGKQLRVWVSTGPPAGTTAPLQNDVPLQTFQGTLEGCAIPEDTSPTGTNLTSWNALEFFKQDFKHDFQHLTVNDVIAACKDVSAWASVIGRLAQDFPQIVAFQIDDFSDKLALHDTAQINQFDANQIADIESRMRSQSPWLNFVPTIYYDYFANRFNSSKFNWADLALTLDSMQFFFRNQKAHACINDTLDCARSADNVPSEIRDMQTLLPSGRELQVGVYFVGCSHSCDDPPVVDEFSAPQIRYSYDVTRYAQSMPGVAGTTAYGLQAPRWIPPGTNGSTAWAPCSGSQCISTCSDFNFLNSSAPGQGTDRFCALQKANFLKPQYVTHNSLDPTGPQGIGNPSGFVASDGTNNAIFRSPDGHMHELWWTTGPVGQGDLTPHGPVALGDPSTFVSPDKFNQVIYRSVDDHLHELWWNGPNPVGQGDLIPHGPLAAADPATFIASDGTNNVIYPSADGHVHELWWQGSNPVGQGDLTPHSPLACGFVSTGGVKGRLVCGRSAAFVSKDGVNHVIYRSFDGHLQELRWSGPNAPIQGDLIPHGPAAAGDPTVFVATDGSDNVIYRDTNGHLQNLFRKGSAAVGQGDLTFLTNSLPAQSNASAYPVTADGRQHVIYRSADGHLHELWWNLGLVTHNDLTNLANAPLASADPSAYFSTVDGRHHVIYLGTDNHLHELWWIN
jgi:hypothetical protein